MTEQTTEATEPTNDDTTTEPTTTEAVEEPKVYDEDYVKSLRDEAASNRVKAKAADDLRDRLRASLCAQASAGVLHEVIPWDDAYDGDDGYPDPEKIKAGVEALAAERPWLARPRGDAGQGFRGDDSGTVDFAALMRG